MPAKPTLPEPALDDPNTEPEPFRARLKRLRINAFRGVEPGTELRFDDGINVMLGRNGTGKTTLLELLVAVATGDLRAYEKESFDLEFDLELAGERISVSVGNVVEHWEDRRPISRILGDDERDSSWRYRVRLDRSDGKSFILENASGVLHAPGQSGDEPSTRVHIQLFLPYFYLRTLLEIPWPNPSELMRFAWPHRTTTNNCLRLDEGLDVFRATTEGIDLPHLGLPLRAVFRRAGSTNVHPLLVIIDSSYVSEALVSCLLKHRPELHEKTELNVSSEDWALLRNTEKLFGVASAQLTMSLVDRRSHDHPSFGVSTFGKPVFRFTTEGGTTYTHDRLSYGEKRLLSFLYHAAANPEILVADEMVNGLHHEWIDACIDAIGGQAFLSSQNPLLLDHLPFSSAEEAQHRFVLCSSDDRGRWVWRNMDPDDADAFYRAYEVGIQHVSEILRAKGLW